MFRERAKKEYARYKLAKNEAICKNKSTPMQTTVKISFSVYLLGCSFHFYGYYAHRYQI